MTGRSLVRLVLIGSSLVLSSCGGLSKRGGPEEAAPSDGTGEPQPIDKSRPAHEVYRNITLFTRDDVSAAFFDELMEGISRDLGVSCLHCHAESGLHVVNVSPRKRLAREAIPVMWRLVGEVNSTYFPGAGGPVRCWTCHRGAATPERANPAADVLPLPRIRPGMRRAGGSAGENLQVLGGLTRSELRRTMRTIAASLGVECNACHLEGDRAADDLERKRVARRMLRMTVAIDSGYFELGRGPTCWSCHRGSLQVETEGRQEQQGGNHIS